MYGQNEQKHILMLFKIKKNQLDISKGIGKLQNCLLCQKMAAEKHGDLLRHKFHSAVGFRK